MKKLIFLLFFLSSFVAANAQYDDTTYYTKYPNVYGQQFPRSWATKVLRIPQDTIYTKYGVAQIGSVLYVGNGTKWNAAGTSVDTTKLVKYSDSTIKYVTPNQLASSSSANTLQTVTTNGNTTNKRLIINGYSLGTNQVSASSANLFFTNTPPDSSTTGSSIMFGRNAFSGSYGNYNVALGGDAFSIAHGDYNVAIGSSSLIGNSGSNNIGIGHGTGAFSSYNYVKLFGNSASATADGQTVFSKNGSIMERLGTANLSSSRLHEFPNASGTFALSVNGTAAGTNGDITITTGSVTSVGLSAPSGFSVSGSPVTSNGTLALSFASGYQLPTIASQSAWDLAYTNRITSATSPLSITSNVISLGNIDSTKISDLHSENYYNTKYLNSGSLANYVTLNGTQTLTNKTIAAGSNTITGLTNSNLSGSAGITNANLANSTISGISLGSNLSNLTIGAELISGGSTTYNGSTARTIGIQSASVTNAMLAGSIDSTKVPNLHSEAYYNTKYLTSTNGVTSFSAGTTGFTPSSTTTGAVTLAGTLNVGNGGTGITSLTANRIPYGNGTSAYQSASTLTYDGTTFITPTIAGSSSSAGNLTLQSTSNATLGNVYLNPMSSGNTNTNGCVFVGRSSADPLPPAGDPNHLFGIVNDSSNKQMFSMWSFGAGSTFQNNMHFYRANGTIASPRALTSGQMLLSMGFRGYDGTAMSQSAAAYQVWNNSAWTTSNHEARFQWEVTDSLSITRLRAMQLNGNGSLWLTKNSSLTPYRTIAQFVIDGVGYNSSNFQQIIQSGTTNGAGIILGESTSNESYIVRYPTALSGGGSYSGTSINLASSTNIRSGSTSNNTLVLGGTPIVGIAGTTATNIGFKNDATGFRIDQIQNINTNNNNAFTVNGKSYFGANSTATALIHLAAGTSTANTAPLKFTSGANLTTVENGTFEYDGASYYASAGGTRQNVFKGKVGSYSGTGTATTAFTVTFGGTQPNATYQVLITPTNSLTAAVLYVTTKTTTAFTVTFLTGLTGTVEFDWALIQQ